MTLTLRCGTTACGYLQRVSARIKACLHFFTITPVCDAIDPPLQERVRADVDGFPLRTQALGQIMSAHQAEVIDLATRRRQRIAAALIDECPQLTGGPAFTFKPRGH